MTCKTTGIDNRACLLSTFRPIFLVFNRLQSQQQQHHNQSIEFSSVSYNRSSCKKQKLILIFQPKVKTFLQPFKYKYTSKKYLRTFETKICLFIRLKFSPVFHKFSDYFVFKSGSVVREIVLSVGNMNKTLSVGSV